MQPKLGPWNAQECWCYCCNNNRRCASCTFGEPYISIRARDMAKDPAYNGRTFYTCLHFSNHSFTYAHKCNVHQVHSRYKLGDIAMGVWSDWKSGMDETRWDVEPCRNRQCDLLTMIVNLCEEGCCTSAGCCNETAPLVPPPPSGNDPPHIAPPASSGLATISTSLTQGTVA